MFYWFFPWSPKLSSSSSSSSSSSVKLLLLLLLFTQYINTTGFRACVKELFVNKHDPLSISYAVMPGKRFDFHLHILNLLRFFSLLLLLFFTISPFVLFSLFFFCFFLFSFLLLFSLLLLLFTKFLSALFPCSRSRYS